MSKLGHWTTIFQNIITDDELDKLARNQEEPYGPHGDSAPSTPKRHDTRVTVDPEIDLFGDFSEGESAPSGGSLIPTDDFWSFNGVLLSRHHIKPRLKLFQPSDVTDCPIPLKWLDVHRSTRTSVGHIKEHAIEDWWDGTSDASRSLSEQWTGTTSFQLVQPECKQKGYMHLSGRDAPVRIQETSRPQEVYPESWLGMSKHSMQLN